MNTLRVRHLVAMLLMVVSTTLVGCTLSMRAYPETHGPSHRPPSEGHPHQGPLSKGEIVEIASWVARDRGYTDFWIEEIEREDHHRWEIEIKGWVGRQRGELEMELDGWDGRILEIEDKRKKHKHDDDDDD